MVRSIASRSAMSTDCLSGFGSRFKHSDELDPSAAAAVSEVMSTRSIIRGKNDYERETVTMRVKMHDKISALREIGKHLGIGTPQIHNEVLVLMIQNLDDVVPYKDRASSDAGERRVPGRGPDRGML